MKMVGKKKIVDNAMKKTTKIDASMFLIYLKKNFLRYFVTYLKK